MRAGRHGGHRARRVALAVAILLAIVGAGGTAATVGVVSYYSADLPSLDNLSASNLPQVTRIYDRSGTLIDELYTENRTEVPQSQISPWLPRATISVEDRTFYQNSGVDYRRIASAAFFDLTHRSAAEGASTITQQVGKNDVLTSEKSISRKIKELILAEELERRYSKDQILSIYLNSIFYGNGSFGAEAAAETYFGVHASQLTLAQASFLAGLPREPSGYDPFAGPDPRAASRERWREVLDSMVATGDITPSAAHAAFTTDIWTQMDAVHKAASPVSGRDPLTGHFVDYVVQYLVKTYGVKETYQGGLNVVTTLDLSAQRNAVRQVQSGVAAYRYKGANTGALLAMDPRNGEILAMVGSANYDDPSISGQVNLTLVPRQPGSSFKIYTYGAALEHGQFNAASKVNDQNPVIDGHRFSDWDGRLEGRIALRRAFVESRNLPALWVYKQLGSQTVTDFARRLGLTTPIDPNSLTVTIGSSDVRMIEHLAAYSAFANGGYRVEPHAILKVTDSQGRPLESYDGSGTHVRVISPELAYLVTDILKGPVRDYLGWPLSSRPVAAKSGTTEAWTGAWWVGYTPTLAVAAFMAHIDNSPKCTSGFAYLASFPTSGWMCPTDVLWGENVGNTVWAPFLQSYYAKHGWPADWTRPPGIVTDTVCRLDGNLATQDTQAGDKYDEIFIRGTGEPSAPCGGVQPAAQPSPSPSPSPPPTASPSPSPIGPVPGGPSPLASPPPA